MRKRGALNMKRKGSVNGGRSQTLLLRRLKQCNQGLVSLDAAINYLRSNFPRDYGRTEEHSLIINVSQALQQLHRPNESYSSDERPVQKRQRQTINNTSSSSTSLDASSSELLYAVRSASKISDEDSKEEFGQGKKGPWFRNIGGMNEVIEDLKKDVIVPLRHSKYYSFGAGPVSGILLHGHPGCGKTMLAHAIANEAEVPIYCISLEVVSGVSGASEEYIRSIFDKARRDAPSIVFIDEMDSIASKRENQQKQMECRILTQLMTCMDEFCEPLNNQHERRGSVVVIGATNRPDAIDPALRRRFEQEITLDVPDENARIQILSALTSSFAMQTDFDLEKLARATPGFVGSDLRSLIRQAAILATRRDIDKKILHLSNDCKYGESGKKWWHHIWPPEDMEKFSIKITDTEEALKVYRPSTTREGFSMIPSVKWEDIGGYNLLRQKLKFAIVDRIKYPKDYEDAGLDMETGFLLYGPPGCGKTLIAKAVANESRANFIYVKGPELLSKYVGESEMAVRSIFSRARKCSPCIIFFDEINALTKKRGKEGAWVVERIVDQLLIELDGAEQRRGVYVIGATNRAKSIDEAILRPGRLGEHLYVPLPDPNDRGLILQTLARAKRIHPSVDLFNLGRSKLCENFSGADLAKLINVAVEIAFIEKRSSQGSSDGSGLMTMPAHFQQALDIVTPSVSKKKRSYYKRIL